MDANSFLPDSSFEHLRGLKESRYRIEEEIGRGGMSVVYRAWDNVLDRPVAMKMIGRGHPAEARVLGQLEHPGIVPVYDAGTTMDGRAFYTMRLVEGEAMDAWLAHEIALSSRLRAFQKICEAVAFAHSRDIVHRDLKPRNIMVGQFGELFVMDWGIALQGVQPAAPAGTPRYTAPDANPDKRSDVFSLGVLLDDLLTEPPPAPLKAIAARAHATLPEDRYSTVGDLAADVARYLDRLPVTAYRENLIEKGARFAARNQVLLLLLGAYLVVRFTLFLLRHG